MQIKIEIEINEETKDIIIATLEDYEIPHKIEKNEIIINLNAYLLSDLFKKLDDALNAIE